MKKKIKVKISRLSKKLTLNTGRITYWRRLFICFLVNITFHLLATIEKNRVIQKNM